MAPIGKAIEEVFGAKDVTQFSCKINNDYYDAIDVNIKGYIFDENKPVVMVPHYSTEENAVKLFKINYTDADIQKTPGFLATMVEEVLEHFGIECDVDHDCKNGKNTVYIRTKESRSN